MQKRFVTIALGVLAIPVLGSIAYAAAHSVSDRPSPQVIIPASSNSSVAQVNHVAGSDDPANHETANSIAQRGAGADRGGQPAGGTVTPTTGGTDDGVGHDIGDDHGGQATPGTVTTIGGDDHGGGPGSGSSGGGPGPSASSVTTVPATTGAPTTVAGHGGSGSDDSGGGRSGGHGADS